MAKYDIIAGIMAKRVIVTGVFCAARRDKAARHWGGWHMRHKGKAWLVILICVAGALIGSALWSMLSGVLPPALTHTVSIGSTGAPLTLDLEFVTLTFGAVLTVNIGGILGIAIALLISLKL